MPRNPLLPNPNYFAGNPLDRASDARMQDDWIARQLASDDAILLPLWRGDPLIVDDAVGWLAGAARGEFRRDACTVFLGLKGDSPIFGIDASPGAPTPDDAPFGDLGEYVPLREAAALLEPEDLAIVGQARWLIDWHRRHTFCAVCGKSTDIAEGGAKRRCPSCEAEHFPRTDPVAIVLAIHEDHCLLGRGPHFPPGVFSALAGYVEAGETAEECAVRELKEEAGVTLSNVDYQFSQPWPFPSSLMMGFFAEAKDRTLVLDTKEVEAALWASKNEMRAILGGEQREDLRLPPRFTIARQLIERWVSRTD